MVNIETFPTEKELDELIAVTPVGMHPNRQPYAVIARKYLTASQCREIIAQFDDELPYSQSHCGATTRQLLPPMSWALRVVEDFVLGMNKIYWQYNLDEQALSWLQTYETGGNYQTHTDTYAGQSRKLTAVVMLTDESGYAGGDLLIDTWPQSLWAPRQQGTIIIFQPWHQHSVTSIVHGLRQTINMGFWGPQFK